MQADIRNFNSGVAKILRTIFLNWKPMTPQEFLENLASAKTDSEKIVVFARYLDTTALDNATSSRWRNLSYSNEIQMSLNNVAFHLEELAESEE